ncbi:hypothetical protein HYT58_01840 [Candidatus Woesearchaeota archaeon]|nr:hypothetical protein [Candidatus Woesearchaeota archaeon]
MSDILIKSLKKFKTTRLHGSRDYFQIVHKGYTFEVVPILDIKDSKDAKNITDVSQLHVDYVLKNKKYQDDIRIGKQFCRANKIYGAESYIRGFSGYAVELLVIHYKGKESPLILIDPVQNDRNAAAALSQEKYEKFIELCGAYLKKPKEDFFIEKGIDLKKKDVVLEIIPVTGKKDVVGAKLVKVLNHIVFNLKKEGFDVREFGLEFDKKSYLWFNVNKKINKTKIVSGPILGMEQHTKAFREKYGNIQVKGNRLYAVINRKYNDVNEYIKEYLKEDNVKAAFSKARFIK